ncbi:hypothetical protein MKW92_038313 [Papaver armeniacum]|nr:hypothetical protein MKW92_038313 [Papaver armeniacum]
MLFDSLISWLLCLLCIVGENIRQSFVECHDDFSGLIDAAKNDDVVMLQSDANYGSGASYRRIMN